MFENITNRNDTERMNIIEENGGTIDKRHIGKDGQYDILRYEGLNVEGLRLLLEKGFADPEERQNCAPPIQDIYDFMCQHPGFTAHGYIVTPNRADYRVSIEGVECCDYDSSDAEAFSALFHDADDFVVEDGNLYCWYD